MELASRIGTENVALTRNREFKWIKVFDNCITPPISAHIMQGSLWARKFCFLLRYQASYPVKLTNEIHKLYHLNRRMDHLNGQIPSCKIGLIELIGG